MRADSAASDSHEVVHLRAGGCSLVLDVRGPGLPTVIHWGADIGELPPSALASLTTASIPAIARSTLERPTPPALLPQNSEGWLGRPGLSGHRNGSDWSPSFSLAGLERFGTNRMTIHSADSVIGLALRSEIELSPSGLLRLRHSVRNQGDVPYLVNELLAALPIPAQATEILDFSGHWCRERHPQRHPLPLGAWVRENRRGRTGHDATIGLLVGTPGFGSRHGEVWAIHVGWSGNHVTYAERWPSGDAILGGGELLLPGEVCLAPGESYATPWVYVAYSARGLDGIASAFHRYMRMRPNHPGPDRPRPVELNTWEAVYFDHDVDRLRSLATTAAAVGVERFVLDDGWFRHRRNETAGLGDWYVDETVWPVGLGPLVEHVRSLGMQFGLWVEPEMVNLDSDLYRAHPDWILGTSGRLPLNRRNQQVLDLVNPAAYDYVSSRLHALLSEYDIAFLKWDHNRDLVDAGHEGHPAVHRQILAVYRLLDELREAHPGVEIESCSSGGARIDLGILERTDRVWPSDCNDALERQTIQRWTTLFLPLELTGTHIGPPQAHTTGRVQDLSFRAATALFGHAGIEWDITVASPEERAALATWIRFYKQKRRLLHTGEVIHVDHPDPAVAVQGVVTDDRSEALYAYVQLATSQFAVPIPVRLPGLDPNRAYRVTPVHPAGPPLTVEWAPPPWYVGSEITLPGSALSSVGLAMPALAPEQALLLQVTCVGR
jgi:alpha-galactosidase